MSQPSALVDIIAPVSGVITEQNVTAAAGVKTLDNSPNLFTIADLSHVWIICDVYENDLPTIHAGEFADIHLNAYPNRVLKGRIANIGPVLDPNIRTAKVRLEVENPGISCASGCSLRRRSTACTRSVHATVPAAAVLHLHDRDWVYVPRRRRTRSGASKWSAGKMLPGQYAGDRFRHQAGPASGRQRAGIAEHAVESSK